MSSVSGSSAAIGAPAVDSDVTLPYESSASGEPQRKRESSRIKPGASRRSKSAPKVNSSRKAKSLSVSRDSASAAAVLPCKVVAGKDRDVLRLESTMKKMGEAWQDLNMRAAQEVSEQQWRIDSTRHELDQARHDVVGAVESARSTVGHVRTEAAESLRNMESIVNRRFALSEEEISKKHNDELRRVESEHQRRLHEALQGMEFERSQLKQSAELERSQLRQEALQGMEFERSQLKQSLELERSQLRQSAELIHSNAVQASSVAQESSSRILQEQRRTAEAMIEEQKRLTEAGRDRERQEWRVELQRREDENAALHQQMHQMKAMMEQMQLRMTESAHGGSGVLMSTASGALPPPPPNPTGSLAAAHVHSSLRRNLHNSSSGPPPGIVQPAAAGHRPGRGWPGDGDGDDPGSDRGMGHDGVSNSSDSPDSSDVGSDGRRRRRVTSGRKEAASITLAPLPAGAAGFRRWKTDAMRDMAGAAARPRRAYKWLLQIADKGVSDRQLNRPGAQFESLDGKILAALGKIISAHPFLQRKLHSYYESRKELTSGRLTLRRTFEHFSTDSDMNGVYSVSDFMQCTLGSQNSEDALERFCEMWIWIETGLVEPVAENIRESLLWTQLKGCSLMQAEINRYRLAPRGNREHTYEFLLNAMQRHVQLYRQDRNREDFLKGLQNAAGGQQRALPAAETDGFVAQTGKVKKPCWLYQKGNCNRANCPFLHDKRAQSDGKGSDGKGKASKTGSTVPTCRYYAQTGKCQYGEKCRFRHASSEEQSGLAAAEMSSGLDGSACIASSMRPPTPPPSESVVCHMPVYSKVHRSSSNDSEECGARDGDTSVACYMVGTSIACSAYHEQNEGCNRKWIVDSGAGLDLISREQLRESELQTLDRCAQPKKLRTANGVAHAENVVTCNIEELCHSVNALVLDKCPPVLSLGRRIEQGYKFAWDGTNGACLTAPTGKVIRLRVVNHVPVLDEAYVGSVAGNDNGVVRACPGEDQTEEEEKHEFIDVDCDDDHDTSPEGEGSNRRKDYMNNGRTKDAVQTRLHELTHFPKNRHCRICREVLKVCTPARRIVPGQETLKADMFGKVIHLDHVFAGSECHGVNGETCALVILDQHTGFIGTYPMTERTGPNVVSAIRHFLGEDVSLAQVGVRADNAKEYEFATRALGLAWYRSTPHRHQSNGKIERCIRSVCEMSRCILVQSGLSHDHWPYAMDHAAMMRNVNVPYHTHGETPWLCRFQEEFKWEIWPFGAGMRALIKGSEKQGKFEANSREAIFLGYEFAPGCVHADYKVATLPTGSGDGYQASVLNIRRTVDILLGGEVVYPAAIDKKGIGECVIRYVPASEADDRTIRMLHEGIVDESGILTESQIERGWTVHRFGERLVKTPPRSTRPPDWTPEDWRSLPTNVRKAFAEIHRDKIGASTASGSDGVVCVSRKAVSFEGYAVCEGESITLSELRRKGGLAHLSKSVCRVVVELCCESDSTIGRRAMSGTLVIRVTQDDDLSEPRNVRYLATQLKVSVRPVLLWVSVPCTTGCPWLRTVPEVRKKPMHQWKAALDKCLSSNALTLVNCACEHKRSVCWEWPRYSDLWKAGVSSELQRLGLEVCDIDGCDFKLMAQDTLIKKPWRIMTNNVSLMRGLAGRNCSGGHEHRQCRGAIAKSSANYTNEFADCIHHAFAESTSERVSDVSILKALARSGGPQNDASSIEERICASYANTLVNVRVSGTNVDVSSYIVEENKNPDAVSAGVRSLEIVLRELEDLLEQRVIPKAPQRTNIAREGDEVRSILLGAYTRRGKGVTSSCLQQKWQSVLRLIHEAAKFREGNRWGEPYAAIQLNLTSPNGMAKHYDQNNVGLSDVISFGEFRGGELTVDGIALSCHRSWATLDGSKLHDVSPVQGKRWSIVLHTPVGIEKLNAKVTKRLRDLGFPEKAKEGASGQGGTQPYLMNDGCKSGAEQGLVGSLSVEARVQPDAACIVDEGNHREHDDVSGFGWGAFITRQIWPSEKEFHGPECQKALKAELDKLIQKGTWDITSVREVSEVRSGKHGPAAIGRVYAIMGEKHSEVEDMSLREYKARIVFQGNNISMSDDVSASEVFKDVSNTPANMSIARTAIGAGLAVGMSATLRDVSQAYLQSYIFEEGEPETWVVLPRAWWPAEWTNADGSDRFKSPCCKLCKALYGHPVSGRRWEQKLEQCLSGMGWKRSEENPGTWIRQVGSADSRHACLVTYVDDLLLVSPESFANEFWRSLEKKLEFKEREAPLYRYLGANHSITGGTMEVEMCGYAQKAVDRFEDELGLKLRVAHTPYVSDGIEKEILKSDERGVHASTASSHIATLLFLARMSRPDLMTSVMKLSRWVSKWEHGHDVQLRRLFEYLKGTIKTCLVSHVQRDSPLEFIIWTDADLNGDPSDSKSTSGLWIELKSEGCERTWPITWNSKRQGGSAYATCESEIIALNNGIREEGIPLHELVVAIVGKSVRMVCREDNTQAIAAVQRGYSKKLRHLPRIYRISIGALSEMLHGPQRVGDLEYHETCTHRADVFTKPLERFKFQQACNWLGLQPQECSREG
eukprot:6490992-Amphidinium_carterae.1